MAHRYANPLRNKARSQVVLISQITAEDHQLSAAIQDANDENGEARLQEIEMVDDNPGSLRMLLYVPANLRPMSPLVVALHGGAQDANDYAVGTGWLSLASRFRFAVLCPQQSYFNNAHLSFNWFEPSDMAREGGRSSLNSSDDRARNFSS